MLGLYIHIPFCSGRCNYCSFVSFKSAKPDISAYLKALRKEMYSYKNFEPSTLYIGGGTPSELESKYLTELLKSIEKNYKPVKDFEESTFEANPESLTKTKIKILKDFGIKRISLGLQSTNNKLLEILGRRHDFNDFTRTFSNLRSVGFANINMDLIIGIPRQTLTDATKDVKKVISLKPEHISLYGLQIERKTVFYEQKMQTNDDLTGKMYENACNIFSRNGYRQYEISNFSRQGFECRHNLNYWNNKDYIGLGVSAVSYLKGIRKCSSSDLETYCRYIKSNPQKIICEKEKLTGKAKIGENLILGLRKTDGIKLTSGIQKNFGLEIFGLKKQKLLKTCKNRLMLTRKGLYLSNIVFRQFVKPF